MSRQVLVTKDDNIIARGSYYWLVEYGGVLTLLEELQPGRNMREKFCSFQADQWDWVGYE